MLDYRVETFLTLCRERNYSKAAKVLCISQPAVTQHIQYLERYYDAKLFCYEDKKLMLTNQGILLERLLLGLRASDSKLFDMIQMSKRPKRFMKVGCSTTIGEYIMPDVIDKVLDHNKEIRIKMGVDNTDTLLDGLHQEEYDCVFIEGNFLKDNYEYALFSKEEVIGISGRPMEATTIEELLSETIIVREEGSGSRRVIENAMANRNMDLNAFKTIFEVHSLSAIKQLVAHNRGISFAYRLAVEKELKEGTLFEIPFDFKIEREFNFVLLQNTNFAQSYRNFYDFAKEIYHNSRVKR